MTMTLAGPGRRRLLEAGGTAPETDVFKPSDSTEAQPDTAAKKANRGNIFILIISILKINRSAYM